MFNLTVKRTGGGNQAVDCRHRQIANFSTVSGTADPEHHMNLRLFREQKLLSQERLAEMSGLSLRTIQRAEAGHTVSYASLRALAACLAMEVDSLEGELCATGRSPDDYVEIPTWVRILDGKRWCGGPGLSRSDLHVVEAFCVGCAVVVFAGSFLVGAHAVANLLRTATVSEVACAYFVSVNIRLGDRYKLWPGAAGASSARPRSWQTRIAQYAFSLTIALLGTTSICMLFR
jgi:DNA-binding XRE family transcriptional regulator